MLSPEYRSICYSALRARHCFKWLEEGELPELVVSLSDILRGHRLQPAHTEVGDGEAGDHAAVDDRPSKRRTIDGARPIEVPEEAPGEGVTRAGRVADPFQRVGGGEEVLVLPSEHDSDVFASLDEDGTRSEREHLART